jgi:hypothetical protein
VCTGLIVKCKADKLKGEVTKLLSGDKFLVRFENREHVRECREKDVGKVIPGDGGVVWISSEKRVGKISYIDMKT